VRRSHEVVPGSSPGGGASYGPSPGMARKGRDNTAYAIAGSTVRRPWSATKRGQATEALLKAEFLIRDVPVRVPEYDNDPYDFVVEVDCAFYGIQAKTAYRN